MVTDNDDLEEVEEVIDDKEEFETDGEDKDEEVDNDVELLSDEDEDENMGGGYRTKKISTTFSIPHGKTASSTKTWTMPYKNDRVKLKVQDSHSNVEIITGYNKSTRKLSVKAKRKKAAWVGTTKINVALAFESGLQVNITAKVTGKR